MPVQLRHLSIEDLIGAAGGDPWKLNDSLQSGSPGQISELATAFRMASECNAQTSEEFTNAQKRFEAAWDRQDGGDHPINQSAEVLRVTQNVNLTKLQISKIAVDLETISASLAEGQRSGKTSISLLEGALQSLDLQIDARISDAASAGENADWADLRQAAIDRTRTSLGEMKAIRSVYAGELSKARQEMAAEGYMSDPTKGADGNSEQRSPAQSAAEKYGATQRAADEVTVNSPGPLTAEKQAAANRLRDYGIINDRAANPDAARYAGERLSDYTTAQTVGPLPTDPVLGGDARSRAKARLDMQQKFEHGMLGRAGMTPDQATAALDQAEAQARTMVIARAQEQLQQAGMSPEGAAKAAAGMSQGIIPKELVEGASLAGKPISGAKEAFDRTADSLPTGNHWNDSVKTYSSSDVEALKKIGGKIGVVGNLVDVGVGLYEWQHGMPAGQVITKTAGGMGAAWAGGEIGAWLGAPGGPIGVAAGAFIGGTLGAYYGEQWTSDIYKSIAGTP